MTKTLKVQLYYKDDENLEYKKAQEMLWLLQRETRAAANRAVQVCWEYNGFESDWKKNNDKYPTKEESREILGKSLQAIAYDRAKEDAPHLNTGNLSSTTQAVTGKFKSLKKDILRGDISIPSYRSDLPIDLHKRNVALEFEKSEDGAIEWFFYLSLFSNSAKKELGLKSGALKFKAVVKKKNAKSSYAILERCYDGVYQISGSKLNYDNGKWYLLLCFSFDRDVKTPVMDKNRVMGVHIGEHNAVTCGFNDSDRKYNISGGEVLAFSAQIEKRRQDIGIASKKHSLLCGDGRIGHGYHAKMQPLEKIGAKVANFRNTVNHRYSRQIVDWAVQNKCGTIQIEDLTGFASEELEKYKLLRNWSYYDLMTKIEYKAKEYGIDVIKIKYTELKRYCPDCKTLSVEETDDEPRYVCKTCGQAFDVNRIVEAAVCIPQFKIEE